jgi:uncharacterized protein (DUF58 family)
VTYELPASIRRRLRRARLRTFTAVATTGMGERRSRAVGSGIEFAGHREYRPGDDVRHLDLNAFVRLRRPVLKQFTVERRLRITILLDATASMAVGGGAKFELAAMMALTLAYCGLQGGDLVRLAALSGSGLSWSEPVGSSRRLPVVTTWLAGVAPHGSGSLRSVANEVRATTGGDGLLVVIGDWLWEDAVESLAHLAAAGDELVAVQVLDRAEVDPFALGSGPAELRDVETDAWLDVDMGSQAGSDYRAELERWRVELREAVSAQRGRWYTTDTGASLETIVLRDWFAMGWIA